LNLNRIGGGGGAGGGGAGRSLCSHTSSLLMRSTSKKRIIKIEYWYCTVVLSKRNLYRHIYDVIIAQGCVTETDQESEHAVADIS